MLVREEAIHVIDNISSLVRDAPSVLLPIITQARISLTELD